MAARTTTTTTAKKDVFKTKHAFRPHWQGGWVKPHARASTPKTNTRGKQNPSLPHAPLLCFGPQAALKSHYRSDRVSYVSTVALRVEASARAGRQRALGAGRAAMRAAVSYRGCVFEGGMDIEELRSRHGQTQNHELRSFCLFFCQDGIQCCTSCLNRSTSPASVWRTRVQ